MSFRRTPRCGEAVRICSHEAVVLAGSLGHARSMSTSSLGDKALTLSALLATLGVVGWAKWTWLKRWWHAVNNPHGLGQ